MTVLAMTGVTALVRGTADRMEKNGILYPDVNIRDVLRSADVTHISNEVSFDPDCPTPNLYTTSLRFCSDPRYINLLEDVGTKVVELTGNHLLDYGPADMLATLDMYTQRGWSYYGGGKDLVDSQKFITIDDHGNKLAFLGCNPAGPASDWATADSPGSAPCDYAAMDANIALLRSAGYLPIVTLQYHEYTTQVPTDYEQKDFRNLAAAGAIIVSGSQAHVPQAMEFYNGSFIHYGLGNLFFDQMSLPLSNGTRTDASRNEFVDRYVFSAGKLISIELLTYRLEDYSQPRPMTPAEREQFLKDIFGSSGW
jgi:poly-gamma-glutamate synthesis protein (capsule biosynthesis protein)